MIFFLYKIESKSSPPWPHRPFLSFLLLFYTRDLNNPRVNTYLTSLPSSFAFNRKYGSKIQDIWFSDRTIVQSTAQSQPYLRAQPNHSHPISDGPHFAGHLFAISLFFFWWPLWCLSPFARLGPTRTLQKYFTI